MLERIHEMDNLERVRITYTGSDIQGLSVGQRLVKATIKRATDEGRTAPAPVETGGLFLSLFSIRFAKLARLIAKARKA